MLGHATLVWLRGGCQISSQRLLASPRRARTGWLGSGPPWPPPARWPRRTFRPAWRSGAPGQILQQSGCLTGGRLSACPSSPSHDQHGPRRRAAADCGQASPRPHRLAPAGGVQHRGQRPRRARPGRVPGGPGRRARLGGQGVPSSSGRVRGGRRRGDSGVPSTTRFSIGRAATAEPLSVLDGYTVLVTEFVPDVPRAERAEPIRGRGGLRRLGELRAELHALPVADGAAARSGGAWHHLTDGGPADEIRAMLALLAECADAATTDQPHYAMLARELADADGVAACRRR